MLLSKISSCLKSCAATTSLSGFEESQLLQAQENITDSIKSALAEYGCQKYNDTRKNLSSTFCVLLVYKKTSDLRDEDGLKMLISVDLHKRAWQIQASFYHDGFGITKVRSQIDDASVKNFISLCRDYMRGKIFQSDRPKHYFVCNQIPS